MSREQLGTQRAPETKRPVPSYEQAQANPEARNERAKFLVKKDITLHLEMVGKMTYEQIDQQAKFMANALKNDPEIQQLTLDATINAIHDLAAQENDPVTRRFLEKTIEHYKPQRTM